MNQRLIGAYQDSNVEEICCRMAEGIAIAQAAERMLTTSQLPDSPSAAMMALIKTGAMTYAQAKEMQIDDLTSPFKQATRYFLGVSEQQDLRQPEPTEATLLLENVFRAGRAAVSGYAGRSNISNLALDLEDAFNHGAQAFFFLRTNKLDRPLSFGGGYRTVQPVALADVRKIYAQKNSKRPDRITI